MEPKVVNRKVVVIEEPVQDAGMKHWERMVVVCLCYGLIAVLAVVTAYFSFWK